MLWLSKLLNPTVIAIRDGRCRLAKGLVKSRTLHQVDGVLAEFGVARGTIAVDGTGRVKFSASVPTGCHQRLRNLIAGT
ncbi:hypothetical protein [Haloferula sargassicola]|uniref:DUF304 domain-containing protein n=1 Tax=Haloferula sargassicola TaxID=490096 RepID=A0ABP9UJL5_9BACT